MRANRGTDNVLNILYVKILRLLLSIMSAWPGDVLGGKIHWLEKCYKVYLLCHCISVLYGEIYYMVTNDLDVLTLGENIVIFLLTVVMTIRIIIPFLKGYKEVVRDFLMDFHLKHYKHRGIHFDKVHRIVEKVCRYTTFYMAILALMGCTFFNLSPLYLNYINGVFSHEGKDNTTHFYAAVYWSTPFFNTFENTKALTTFNLYGSILCASAICILDLLVILMAIHIIGHILILRKNLNSITGPEKSENVMINRGNFLVAVQQEVYTKEENRKIKLILKDCVDHHRVIVRFTDKMSDFFGFMLAFNYTFHLVGLCILLLQTTQGDVTALVRFGPLTLIIFGELIQISVVFEIVGTVSEKLPDALYCIPWECLNVSNQRSVCILLQRLQRPIHITAMGMTSVGVTTMAGILKTTLSYFAFLRSLNE